MPEMSSSKANPPCHNSRYTLYWGRFIQLPRKPDTPATPLTAPVYCLDIWYGAVWVNSSDGRIAGCKRGVKSEQDLDNLAEHMHWQLSYTGREVGPVTGDGVIEESASSQYQRKHRVRVISTRDRYNGFFFPGFIDAHIHSSQYPNAGLFGTSTLLGWLNEYVYPMEATFENKEDPDEPPKRAHVAYNAVVSRTLSLGTTCAAYYTTIHVPATNLLASICFEKGQRAFIGRTCMDYHKNLPDYYRDESTEAMWKATEATIEYIRKLDSHGTLVNPIITPRFALSCTKEALPILGSLAQSSNPPYHIQAHISEDIKEGEEVLKMYPECKTYAEVYEKAKLLTGRTVLGHGVHLTPDDMDTISGCGSGVAHCPASNSALGSGLCPVRKLLDAKINVGLGTDVAGGYSPSILETARQAALVSRLVAFEEGPETTGRVKITAEEALYLATRGGAKVLDMEHDIGGFEEGMLWDAQMIELGENIESASSCDIERDRPATCPRSLVDIFGWESWEERVAKWMWNGDDRNVRAVWVGGRLVHGSVN